MKAEILSISGEALEEFRTNLDAALALTVREMEHRRLPIGTVTAKIEIELEERQSMDGEIVRTLSVKPDVNMKLGAKAKIECKEKKGLIMQLNQDGKPIVASSQVSIDELLAEQEEA